MFYSLIVLFCDYMRILGKNSSPLEIDDPGLFKNFFISVYTMFTWVLIKLYLSWL